MFRAPADTFGFRGIEVGFKSEVEVEIFKAFEFGGELALHLI